MRISEWSGFEKRKSIPLRAHAEKDIAADQWIGQLPARSRLQEIMVCGHCRLTQGSTAMYNIHTAPEMKSAVLMAIMARPMASPIDGRWLRQRKMPISHGTSPSPTGATLPIASSVTVVSPGKKSSTEQSGK